MTKDRTISMLANAYERKWLGTPFRPHSGAPGARGGVDCVHLAADWLLTLGLVDSIPKFPPYAVDWGSHNGKSLIKDTITTVGWWPLLDVIPWTPELQLQTGDVVACNIGQSIGHLLVSVDGDRLLHAYRGSVVTTHRMAAILMLNRRHKLLPEEIYRPKF